jgi:hypothetical protein
MRPGRSPSRQSRQHSENFAKRTQMSFYHKYPHYRALYQFLPILRLPGVRERLRSMMGSVKLSLIYDVN